MSGQVRLKGRFIKKKTLAHQLSRNASLVEARKTKNSVGKVKPVESVCKGRRIVDVQELAKNMKCLKCQQILGLENIVSERMNGLHAVWNVKCIQCLLETEVHTGKKHVTKNNKKFADVNTRAVLGGLDSGSGCTALNKLLACLSIPTMSDYMFKKYKQEIGSNLEETAEESCKGAAEEKREATVERMEQLCRES